MPVLQRKVLMLNSGWTPVNVCSVKRALNLIFKNHAIIINTEQKDDYIDYRSYTWADWSAIKPENDEECIVSSHFKFKIPEVIKLVKYSKYHISKVNFNRRAIYKRDDNQCKYCGKRPGTELLSIDHIIPRSRGGQLTWTNVVVSCVKCNAKKANKTPEEAGMKFFDPNYKPEKPNFQIFKQEIEIDSWKNFISEAYWTVPLI